MDFKNSKVFQIIKERWSGKDMDQELKTRSEEYLLILQDQIKIDYSKLEWVDGFEGGQYIKKQ
jgi:hypothetical protein